VADSAVVVFMEVGFTVAATAGSDTLPGIWKAANAPGGLDRRFWWDG